MIGGGYSRRVSFLILRLRYRPKANIELSFAGEKDLRASTRFGQKRLYEILTAKHGGPELAYAPTSRNHLRRQPREYLENEFSRNRQRDLLRAGHRSRNASSTTDVLPRWFHGGDRFQKSWYWAKSFVPDAEVWCCQ